ncbi:MAG TPA: ferritin-like domain-containing protein [Burkholderiaceae bacterium]|jgi:ferritin-like metal-binding protein YciE|nr:ferritin-like domain-containing protein [Burkholderiaceae bacterium]
MKHDTKQSNKMGSNRTGIQMSPVDSKALLEAAQDRSPDVAGDGSAISEMRRRYAESAEPLGSVPPPGTVRGAAKTGAAKISGSDPELLLDKLGERLAFERSSARVYDAMLVKFQAEPAMDGLSLQDLQQIRDDEIRHLMMLNEVIESLGADATAQTPSADTVGVLGMGIVQVVSDPRTTLQQALAALLTAELTDNAGWELLMKLARQSGYDEIADRFQVALEEEQRHLHKIRSAIEIQVLDVKAS